MKPDDLIKLGLLMHDRWPCSEINSFEIDRTFDDSVVWRATLSTTDGTKELWLIGGDWVGWKDIERW